MQARDELGRLVPVNCPDENCGGVLVYEPEVMAWGGPPRHRWRCDGLTHERGDDPLVACPREIIGPVI